MGYLRPRRRQLPSSGEHQGEPCADPPPAGRIRDGKGVGGPLGRFIALEAAHGIAIGLALDPSGPRRPRCSGVAGETHHGDAPEGVVGPACARSVDVAGHLPRRGLDRGGSAKGGEGGSAADALARVERACSALRQDSKPITFVSIALLAGVSRTSLYRDPSLRAVVDEHGAAQVDPRTLSGLAREVDHLRTAVEVLADRVRHHEEQLCQLEKVSRSRLRAN